MYIIIVTKIKIPFIKINVFFIPSRIDDDDDHDKKKKGNKKGSGQKKKKKKNGQSSSTSNKNKKKKKKDSNKKSSNKNSANKKKKKKTSGNKSSANKNSSNKKKKKKNGGSKKSALPSNPILATNQAKSPEVLAPVNTSVPLNASTLAVSSQKAGSGTSQKIGLFGGGGLFNKKPQDSDEDQCHIVSGWDCPRFGRHAHPIDCQKYVWCTFRGNNTVYECGEDEAYDLSDRDCSADWSSCEALTDCLYDRELLEDPSDDQAYFICIEQSGGIRRQKQFSAYRRWCQDGRTFDLDYQRCMSETAYDIIEEEKRKRKKAKRKAGNKKKGGNKKSGSKKKGNKKSGSKKTSKRKSNKKKSSANKSPSKKN